MIELGSKVRDIVTGFTGVTTARTEYITGCVQYSVVPKGQNSDGTLKESYWFDEIRLKVLAKPEISITPVEKGFDSNLKRPC